MTAAEIDQAWKCPVCGRTEASEMYRVPVGGSEAGVDPEAFRPSSERFGHAPGTVVRCRSCGHGSLLHELSDTAISAAYANASDPVSVREEPGQVETARRALRRIERHLEPGSLCDIGCWTGSFLVAARERGWHAVGVEPSVWASARGRERGVDIRTGELSDAHLASHSYRLVVVADVLEHLHDPGVLLAAIRDLLERGGAVYVTVPDAGSLLARLLGRRWWSVLPMHLQYFTRESLSRLVRQAGFDVVELRTHPKVFTARYYAERLGGYSAVAERLGVGLLERARLADRLIAPDFRDRMALLAVRSRH